MEVPPTDESLARLEALAGQWNVEAVWPEGGPTAVAGTCTFEWDLGGRYLVQRSEVTIPEAPDTLAIIGPDQRDDAPAAFVQHYFDSRGVTRIYSMELDEGRWRLDRNRPDFSALDFWQFYEGEFSDDGNTIHGAWNMSEDDGTTWSHDFALNYTRMT